MLVDDVKTKQTKALCPFNPTVVTHFDMFISVAAVVHMLAAVFCRQQLHPWPHPQVHACTRKAKPLTFVHMSAGGVLPTHCSALLERPEAQSGGRQDLGRTRVWGVGGMFVMSQRGCGDEVGLLKLDLLTCFSLNSHGRWKAAGKLFEQS